LDEPKCSSNRRRLAVGGFVAVNSKGVELVEDHLRRDRDEGVILQEIDERRLIRLWQPKLTIDVLRQILAEEPKLDERARRICVRIGLRETAKARKFGPPVTKDLEIERLHAIASASAASKAARFATTTGISCGLSSLSAMSKRRRF